MATRKERVILDLDARPYVRGLATAGAATSAFVKNLDTADSRMGNIVQTALALAPALVPIGGAGVTAVAGLSTQLGFAVAGMGAMVLGTAGVGDALEALNTYQLEPTTENLEKLQDSLRGLGPEAREFVLFLDEITPKLQRLRREAQSEWLPGVESGLDDLLDNRLPAARRIIEQLSRGSGVLAAQAGAELSTDDWDEFFRFLEDEAQPTLVAFGRTTGNIFEALANTWMAMDPASDDFTAGLLEWSRGLAESTENLDESQGFQEFLSFIREEGPEAVDTLGSVGGALLELVEAAAPVGSASLPIIRAVADVLSTVADSPAGPVLIGAAAGMSAVSRAVAVFNAANGSAILGLLRGTAASGPAAGAGATAAATGLGSLNRTVSGLKTAAGVGLPVLGSLALASSDLDDKAGLANTAMFALMGTMIAPGWGTAIGASIGAIIDLTARNDDLAASVERLQEVGVGSDLASMYRSIADTEQEVAALRAKSAGFGNLGGGGLNRLLGEPEDIRNAEAQIADTQRVIDAYEQLVRGMGVNTSTLSASGEWVPDIEAIEGAIRRAQPALTALGISIDDLEQMDSSELETLVLRIRAWNREADSGTARTGAIRDAIAGLDDELITTADSAKALEDTLAALLGPQLGVSAATDQWTTSLRTLREELADNRTLVGDSNAAITNREAIRSRIGDIQNLLVAQAEAGASSRKVARSLREQREALLDAGEAAGLSREELRAYIDEMGLTPKIVRTLIQAQTGEAQRNVQNLLDKMAQVRNIQRTVTVTTVFTGGGKHFKDVPSGTGADGTRVPKTGLPYADRHPYLLADGERVTSNRFGQADKWDRVLSAINSDRGALTKAQLIGQIRATQRLADGGTAGSSLRATSSTTHVLPASLDGVRVEGYIDGRGYLRGVMRDVDKRIEATERHHANLEGSYR